MIIPEELLEIVNEKGEIKGIFSDNFEDEIRYYIRTARKEK